jgi:tRNA/rRNA methyltransferase
MGNHSQSGQSKGQSKSGSILQQTRIILVEPAGPLNIGSVARILKNFGLSRLSLVQPQCDPWGQEARQMAVHAQDVLLGATIVQTLPEALQGSHHIVATTGRSDTIPFPLVSPRDFVTQLMARRAALVPQIPTDRPPTDSFELAILFGREDRGLTHAELTQAHQVLEIPTSEDYTSLNLAQAVAICCYELFQGYHQTQTIVEKSPNNPSLENQLLQNQAFSQPVNQGNSLPDRLPATYDQLEGYYQQLEDFLLRISYLYPHTATSRMEKFRHLYQRANLSDQEVAMLRGILRQTEWALEQQHQA